MSTPDTPADRPGPQPGRGGDTPGTTGPDAAGQRARDGASGAARAAGQERAGGSGQAGEQARTIASGTAQTHPKKPVITGTAAARILGQDAEPVSGGTPSDRAAAQRAQNRQNQQNRQSQHGYQNQQDYQSQQDSRQRQQQQAAGGSAGGSHPRPARVQAPATAAGNPAAPTSGGKSSGQAAGPGSGKGKGIDAPTSHIDRASVPGEQMPDLASVRQPAQPRRQAEQHSAQPRVTAGVRRSRGPLRAAMQLRAVDPWSALKVSLLVSVAMFLVWMVAVAIIYVVLDGMGVWERLNSGVTDIISDSSDNADLIGPGQVFGVAAILGVINIVLFTALCTLGSFVYNLTSDMVGGVEVTLADRD